jgi:hypothetical protein
MLTIQARSMKIVAIFDSFVDVEENELFLCELDSGDLGWFESDDLPGELKNEFIGSNPPEDENPSCNTSKDTQYKCVLKSRTRGLQVACSNCGFILGYREMFCSESSSQVAMLYLDLKEAYGGTQFA